MKILSVFILILITWTTALAESKSYNLIRNKKREIYYLNHDQKLAVKLNDALKRQFSYKMEVADLEIPKEYKILDFESQLQEKKESLKKNNQVKNDFSSKQPETLQ